MKVLLVNGSPHMKGSTYKALETVAESLNKNGVETTIFQIGSHPISGCLGCGYCRAHAGECVGRDVVNEFTQLAANYDGYIFGTSVHYAAATGAITAFMDRAFFSAGSKLAFKPAASVVVCRRGGASATFDQINKYFTINNMPIVSSNYWNSVHASTPELVEKDEEGLQTLSILGANMAWLLKCMEAGKNAGITHPTLTEKIATVFAK